jgi:hypothetical protein
VIVYLFFKIAVISDDDDAIAPLFQPGADLPIFRPLLQSVMNGTVAENADIWLVEEVCLTRDFSDVAADIVGQSSARPIQVIQKAPL